MTGRTADGRIETVRIVPDGSPVANYGFDVTPARLVTGLITERGVIAPIARGAAPGLSPNAPPRQNIRDQQVGESRGETQCFSRGDVGSRSTRPSPTGVCVA